jgi:biopolymer transport protein ExbD
MERSTRDPHAHVIHVPGPRLGRSSPLRFVRERARGGRRRALSASLNMASFLDVLLVTVLFLLQSFGASAETPGPQVRLPSAANGVDPVESPIVTVTSNIVLVDGVMAGSARAIAESGRLARVEELGKLLEQKRALWLSVQPNRPFPGECLLQIDEQVPAVVVKSVFQTAVKAGYPRVSFLVQKRPAR